MFAISKILEEFESQSEKEISSFPKTHCKSMLQDSMTLGQRRYSQLRPTYVALLVIALALSSSGCGGSSGSSGAGAVAPVANACARAAEGSVAQDAPALQSKNGVLFVNFSYQSTTDAEGRTLYCWMTPNGVENPTLELNPGDRLKIKVTNNTASTAVIEKLNPPRCGSNLMTGSSMNMHFHGTNTSPTCHEDDITRALINSGQTFSYDVQFPADEPPGLYWYHPHVHMLANAAVLGGATGAIVVEGIEKLQPAVAGLAQRVLVIRDQVVTGNPPPGPNLPGWDLSLDYVPISYPANIPAIIQMPAGQQQFWRVLNSAADTFIDLQLVYDGVPQNLQLVALDGVPTGSQDGTSQGQIINTTDIFLPTGGRAEFIVSPPGPGVETAVLNTNAINTGTGDNDPLRTLATIQTVTGAAAASSQSVNIPAAQGTPGPQRFAGLAQATPTTARDLYFSQDNQTKQFFITVQGATPTVFNANNPPSVVTTEGSVEDWTVENQATEIHDFHIHQIHFLVESQNNFQINGDLPVSYLQNQMLDTINIAGWDGNPAHPYPSVTLRMDFRGPVVGNFVYHCHILSHEDKGMMAIIEVTPSTASAVFERFRIWLASLDAFGVGDVDTSTWCVAGKLSRRLSRSQRLSGGFRDAPSSDRVDFGEAVGSFAGGPPGE